MVTILVVSSIGSVLAQEVRPHEPDPGGPPITGAIVESRYGTTQWSMQVEDYYMSVAQAREFASKLDVSATEALFWLGTSFIPHWNYTFGLVGGLNTIYRGLIASKIREYTDINKRVVVTIMKDSYGTYYSVAEWDGKYSSIIAYPGAPNRSNVREISRSYR